MLASILQMDAAHSLPRNPDSLMTNRPSAEDLDAAHQLISSSQAGREHSTERSRDDGVDIDDQGPKGSGGEVSAGEKALPKTQSDASLFSHSCRFVGPQKKKKKKFYLY